MQTKALILAAGEGTRLRPLTNTVPKVMVPIGGKPLLAYHLEQLKRSGIKEVLINTHWLPEEVERYCQANSTGDFQITAIREQTLLGSAGTLLDNNTFFDGAEDILVIYGDVLNDLDYQKLVHWHRQHNGTATIVCHEVPNVHEKGMVIIDSSDQISQFVEKPKPEAVVSNYVNGGIYVFKKEILALLKPLASRPLDFGHDVFPFMLKEGLPLLAYKLDGFLLDVGTKETYKRANEEINQLNLNT